MVKIARIDPFSYGALNATAMLLLWLIYAIVTAGLPHFVPALAGAVADMQWPDLVSDTNAIVSAMAPNTLTIGSLYPNVPPLPLYGIVFSVVSGVFVGFIIALVYNITSEYLTGGIVLEMDDRNVVSHVGVFAFAKVLAVMVIAVSLMGLGIVGLIGFVFGPLWISLKELVDVSVLRLLFTIMVFILAIILAFAFNFATGLVGGVGVKLDREYDGYALVGVDSFSFAKLFWVLVPIAQLLDFAVKKMVLGSSVGVVAEQVSLLSACAYGFAIAYALALLYNHVVSKVAVFRFETEVHRETITS